ncbi:hypothetical protein RJT34_19883 [Clitoria ternatea]|uniref:NADP-dependent oxidoreductase domain-containing protein n=1 Tax=Clitoria ternatea TaxID=43366 RepID=A0AAN9P462_CLITE
MEKEAVSVHIPQVKLGTQGFEVSKLGFGCMNLSGAYNKAIPQEEGISIIKHAFSKGITFFDTSDIYGENHANEHLVGKVGELKKLVEEGKVRELGIGIVPYSPLGRGFFGGKGVLESVSIDSSLTAHPWFTAENLEKNKRIYGNVERLTKKHHSAPPQLALAWVLHQGNDVAPIPVGTMRDRTILGPLLIHLQRL